jgi:hypothetical protein
MCGSFAVRVDPDYTMKYKVRTMTCDNCGMKWPEGDAKLLPL